MATTIIMIIDFEQKLHQKSKLSKKQHWCRTKWLKHKDKSAPEKPCQTERRKQWPRQQVQYIIDKMMNNILATIVSVSVVYQNQA